MTPTVLHCVGQLAPASIASPTRHPACKEPHVAPQGPPAGSCSPPPPSQKENNLVGGSYEGPGSETHTDTLWGEHRDPGIPEGPEAHSQAGAKPRQIQKQPGPGSPASNEGATGSLRSSDGSTEAQLGQLSSQAEGRSQAVQPSPTLATGLCTPVPSAWNAPFPPHGGPPSSRPLCHYGNTQASPGGTEPLCGGTKPL